MPDVPAAGPGERPDLTRAAPCRGEAVQQREEKSRIEAPVRLNAPLAGHFIRCGDDNTLPCRTRIGASGEAE